MEVTIAFTQSPAPKPVVQTSSVKSIPEEHWKSKTVGIIMWHNGHRDNFCCAPFCLFPDNGHTSFLINGKLYWLGGFNINPGDMFGNLKAMAYHFLNIPTTEASKVVNDEVILVTEAPTIDLKFEKIRMCGIKTDVFLYGFGEAGTKPVMEFKYFKAAYDNMCQLTGSMETVLTILREPEFSYGQPYVRESQIISFKKNVSGKHWYHAGLMTCEDAKEALLNRINDEAGGYLVLGY